MCVSRNINFLWNPFYMFKNTALPMCSIFWRWSPVFNPHHHLVSISSIVSLPHECNSCRSLEWKLLSASSSSSLSSSLETWPRVISKRSDLFENHLLTQCYGFVAMWLEKMNWIKLKCFVCVLCLFDYLVVS